MSTFWVHISAASPVASKAICDDVSGGGKHLLHMNTRPIVPTERAETIAAPRLAAAQVQAQPSLNSNIQESESLFKALTTLLCAKI